LLDQEKAHPGHKDADMFVMFVLSHGEDGHFYTLDGKKISIDKIVNSFDAHECPALRGKPKLFFIQACQGGKPRTLYNLQQSFVHGYFKCTALLRG